MGKNNLPQKIIAYIDGGARGNPGPAGIGLVINNEKGDTLRKYSEYLGDKFTNNVAEYQALIFALKKIKALFGKKKVQNMEVEIRSDSELLVRQMTGLYKIVAPEIQHLFIKAWNLRIDFGKVNFKLVPREKNKEADRLVNNALDAQGRSQKLI